MRCGLRSERTQGLNHPYTCRGGIRRPQALRVPAKNRALRTLIAPGAALLGLWDGVRDS